MTGKVFKESADIYQDQARVLFDYYKAAAQKIVDEETACEKERADLEENIREAQNVKAEAEKKAEQLKIYTLILIITVIGWIFTLMKRKEQLDIAADADQAIQTCAERLQDVNKRFKSIRRDYTVNNLGVVYVPVATRVPFGEKSFLIDHTGAVDDKVFQLPILHQPEEFQRSMQELEQSTETMPVIEGNDAPEEINTSEYSLSVQNLVLHDYTGNVDRQMRNISYLLSDTGIESVKIPVIYPQSQEFDFIREYATSDVGGKPVVEVFDSNFEDKLSKLTQIDASKEQFNLSEDTDSIEYMKRMMFQLADVVQIAINAKNAGASALDNYASGILAIVLKAGYTQYSPSLEAEEIERIRTTNFDYQTLVNDYMPFSLKKSSQVKYDLISGSWVAEDGSRTAMPFGVHQVDEEVLQPVIEALMAENRVERLKVYANIEEEKRRYLERWSSEIGNYYRDNRAACDEIINRMRDTYADYAAAYSIYKSVKETMDNMKLGGPNNVSAVRTNGTTEDRETIEDELIENELDEEDDTDVKSNVSMPRSTLGRAEVQEIDSEAEMIAGFEKQAEECNNQQEHFAEYMDRIQENINELTEEFSRIEYFEGSLRDGISHDIATAMADVHNLEIRQRQLLNVSPYLAMFGKLPPEPKVTDAMCADIQVDLREEVRQQLAGIDSAVTE